MTLVSAAAQASRPRLDHIDGLRATAALVVFVNHAYAQVWHPTGPVQPSGLYSAFSYSLVAGHLAVTVFIVISGFCLTLPVIYHGTLRGGVVGFMKNRARRILPPYYAALLLCLLLIATIIGDVTGSLWDVPVLRLETTTLISHFILMQDLFGTGAINYAFWSIAVEWHIYFLVPLLVWSWRKLGPWQTVLAALIVGYALRIGLAETRVERANPHYIGMFALGMLAAYVARSTEERYVKLRKGFPWVALGMLGLLGVAAVTKLWGVVPSTERFYILDLPIGLMAAAALVLASGPEPGRLTRIFNWRPLVAIGTFSYSLYLIHAPLLQILWLYVMKPLNLGHEAQFIFLHSIGLGLVLLASYGFHLAFEAPFMKAPQPKQSSQPAPVATP
jgi:peptidoglycan/LPS O-acetylase OafA/YrhL